MSHLIYLHLLPEKQNSAQGKTHPSKQESTLTENLPRSGENSMWSATGCSIAYIPFTNSRCPEPGGPESQVTLASNSSSSYSLENWNCTAHTPDPQEHTSLENLSWATVHKLLNFSWLFFSKPLQIISSSPRQNSSSCRHFAKAHSQQGPSRFPSTLV